MNKSKSTELKQMPKWLAPLAVAVLAIAACDFEGPQSIQLYASPRGSIDPLISASQGNKAVPVHSLYAPDDAIANQFTTLLTQRIPSARLKIAASDFTEDRQSLHILLLHDTPMGYTAVSACQGKQYSPSDETNRMTLRIAICQSNARLVEVSGSISRASESLEKDFDALLRTMMPQVLVKSELGR